MSYEKRTIFQFFGPQCIAAVVMMAIVALAEGSYADHFGYAAYPYAGSGHGAPFAYSVSAAHYGHHAHPVVAADYHHHVPATHVAYDGHHYGHSASYVAANRGSVHSAPLIGHIVSQKSVNTAPAPGTNY